MILLYKQHSLNPNPIRITNPKEGWRGPINTCHVSTSHHLSTWWSPSKPCHPWGHSHGDGLPRTLRSKRQQLHHYQYHYHSLILRSSPLDPALSISHTQIRHTTGNAVAPPQRRLRQQWKKQFPCAQKHPARSLVVLPLCASRSLCRRVQQPSPEEYVMNHDLVRVTGWVGPFPDTIRCVSVASSRSGFRLNAER